MPSSKPTVGHKGNSVRLPAGLMSLVRLAALCETHSRGRDVTPDQIVKELVEKHFYQQRNGNGK